MTLRSTWGKFATKRATEEGTSATKKTPVEISLQEDHQNREILLLRRAFWLIARKSTNDPTVYMGKNRYKKTTRTGKFCY
jgi:hypothetical protein